MNEKVSKSFENIIWAVNNWVLRNEKSPEWLVDIINKVEKELEAVKNHVYILTTPDLYSDWYK